MSTQAQLGPPSTVLTVLVLLLVSTSCSVLGGPERSIEAYCDTLETEAAALDAKYQERLAAADEDPLAGLFIATSAALEMTGDMALLAERLADHAPEDVQPEHEIVAETLREQVDRLPDTATDPMAALFASFTLGTANQGAFATVDSFALEHCGLQLFGSAPVN